MDLDGQQWLAENAATVLDAVVDAIITMDVAGQIQSVNLAAESLFGYRADELQGQPVTMLMPEPHRSAHQHYVQRYLETQAPQIIGVGRELSALRKDGSEFPIYLAVSEIPGQAYFVGIIRDLTEQKAAEAALAEQKERVTQVGRLATMGEMTASIAHEVNQPLTAIAAYAQAIVRLLDKPDVAQQKVRDALEKLNTQALRAGAVIERIQRFVQNESGERMPYDLTRLINEIDQLAQGDARMHGITLALELAQDLPEVVCDPVQIQQVLLNLVRNSIDAMYEIECAHGNEVKVCAKPLGESWVEVSVQDCGPGVADSAGRVFDAFQSTKVDGMGMGLAICKSILDDHQGDIGYYNLLDASQPADATSSAKGAVFYFRLPIATVDAVND